MMTDEKLNKLKIKAENGLKINVLIESRNKLKTQILQSNTTRSIEVLAIKRGTESEKIIYSENIIPVNSATHKDLGKELCERINAFNARLKHDFVTILNTHTELKIQLIDKLLEELGNEESDPHT